MQQIYIVSCGTRQFYELVHDAVQLAPQLNFLAHSTGPDLFDLLERHHPHVVLLEVRSDNSDILDIIKTVSDRLPEAAILVLAHALEAQQIQEALRFGARGYLLWPMPIYRLTAAIQLTQAGKLALSSEALSLIFPRKRTPKPILS